MFYLSFGVEGWIVGQFIEFRPFQTPENGNTSFYCHRTISTDNIQGAPCQRVCIVSQSLGERLIALQTLFGNQDNRTLCVLVFQGVVL